MGTKRGIFFIVLAGVLLVSCSVSAGNYIAFQGNVDREIKW